MAGDVPSDFAAWYGEQHPRLVASLAAVSRDLDAVRDAADEAFARSLLHWSRVQDMASPAGWTYRVALNELRRKARRRTLEQRLLRRTTAAHVVPAPRYEEVWALLDGLPPRQRTAMVLRYVADPPEAEIATAMGVRRGTVASTLADARRTLAAHLDPTEANADA